MLSIFRNFEYFKFFVGQFFAHTADAMMQIILIAYISAIFQPAGAKIALVFFVFLFPQFVFSNFAGIIADKCNKKTVLTVSNLFRAAVVFFIALLAGVQNSANQMVLFNFIYLFAFLLGAGYAFYYAAKMSIIKDIVLADELKTANTLNTGFINFLNIAGVAFAGLYILMVNLQYTIIVAGVFYVFSSLGFRAINYNPLEKEDFVDTEKKFSQKFISYVLEHRKTVQTLALSVIISVTSAIFFNIINCLTMDVFKTGISGLVYFRTMAGVGILTGMVFTVTAFKFFKVTQLQLLGFFMLSIALYFVETYKTLTTSFIPLIMVGFALTILLVSIDTTLMKISAKNKRGQVFGLQLACNTVAFLCGTLLMSKLPEVIDVLLIMKSLGILCFITLLIILSAGFIKNVKPYILTEEKG